MTPLQVCPQLHGQRVRRHDIVDAISSDCMQKKHAVAKEPHIPTALGTRKPDLLICDVENKKAYVLDVKIASDCHFNYGRSVSTGRLSTTTPGRLEPGQPGGRPSSYIYSTNIGTTLWSHLQSTYNLLTHKMLSSEQ